MRYEQACARLNSEARAILEQSLREALSLGHNYVGPEHLARALLRSYTRDLELKS